MKKVCITIILIVIMLTACENTYKTNENLALSKVNQEAASCDFLKNFMEVPSRTIENVHALVPQYLKESDAYKA